MIWWELPLKRRSKDYSGGYEVGKLTSLLYSSPCSIIPWLFPSPPFYLCSPSFSRWLDNRVYEQCCGKCKRKRSYHFCLRPGLPGGRFSGPKFKSGRFQDPPGDFSLLKKGPPEFGRFWAILGPPGRYLTFEKRPNKIWAILGNFRPSWLYFQKRPNQNWVILDNFGVNLTQFLSNLNFH